ncbi:hypothetical protein [Streptomyces sp. NPDC003077]|uniref:TolB family protein n=1 Tax=Streptomyces sp. NPDC003077 TaxID=3154443 RepID=UPI0033B5803C
MRRTITAVALVAGACVTAGLLPAGTAAARSGGGVGGHSDGGVVARSDGGAVARSDGLAVARSGGAVAGHSDGGVVARSDGPAVARSGRPATERVSVAADGTQGNGFSASPSISANGRYVAFSSQADNLVPGDTNGAEDVFVKDLVTGAVDRVSVTTDGIEGTGRSSAPMISGDGRYVAFRSDAANLVPGDTNDEADVFVHDRRTGRTESPTAGTGTSPYGYGVQSFVLSANGRTLAFGSGRSDLVPGDTNGADDIFAWDLRTRKLRRASVAGDGTQADAISRFPTLSADGRTVGFTSEASNLTDGRAGFRPPPLYPMYVHDLDTGRTSVASRGSTGEVVGVTPETHLSPDGRYAIFDTPADDVVPGDTNNTYDIFVRDLKTGTVRLASRAHDGAQGNGWAADGRLSANNRYLFFNSVATNLVPGDTNGRDDGFVRDLKTGAVQRINLAHDGGQSTSWVNDVVPDASGRLAAFDSRDEGLVPGDTNATGDVFVRRVTW